MSASVGASFSVGAAEIVGTNRADVLVGNAGIPDAITALGGDDRIVFSGMAGWDDIDCGPGSDTLDLSRIRIRERTGADLSAFRAPNSQVFNCENVIGTDSPLGDDIRGDGRNNRLTGGLGADSLAGGAGADRFAYRSRRESTPANPDRIVDFDPAEGDRIDFSVLAKARKKRGAVAFQYIGENDFGGRRGQVRTADGAIQVDFDGDRSADMTIRFGSAGTLPPSAFILE